MKILAIFSVYISASFLNVIADPSELSDDEILVNAPIEAAQNGPTAQRDRVKRSANPLFSFGHLIPNGGAKEDHEAAKDSGVQKSPNLAFSIGSLFSNIVSGLIAGNKTDEASKKDGNEDKGGTGGKKDKGKGGLHLHLPGSNLINHVPVVSNILHLGGKKPKKKDTAGTQINIFANFQRLTKMGREFVKGDVVGAGIDGAELIETLKVPIFVRLLLQVSVIVMKVAHPVFLNVMTVLKTVGGVPGVSTALGVVSHVV